MSRKSRNKGARFELEMLRHLQARGYSAMKSQQRKAGGGDFPDVLAVQASGNLPLHVECKNIAGLPSVQHMDALAQAQATLPKDGGVALAVHKLARKPIEDAIVTMRLGDFLALYERGGMGGSPTEIDESLAVFDAAGHPLTARASAMVAARLKDGPGVR